jgi:hypothetical protein
MTERMSLSLRKAIFSKIAKSDGAYVMIYSGAGEKLTFISFLLDREDDSGARLLLDFSLNENEVLTNQRDFTLIDSMSRKLAGKSPESFSLEVIRQKLRHFANCRQEPERIIIVVDCSSFLNGVERHLPTPRAVKFHKSFLDMINSMEGVTGVLLYNLQTLTADSVSLLLQPHMTTKEAIEKLTLEDMEVEFDRRLRSGIESSEMVMHNEGLFFTDPATNSAALILPVSEEVKEVLPNDPLDVRHRDIAFSNNYTAGDGTCPYLVNDVSSQCILDPNAVKVGGTSGRPFAMGRPCETATDHMVIDAKSPQQTSTAVLPKPKAAKDFNNAKEKAY